jgi:hypothetical protein
MSDALKAAFIDLEHNFPKDGALPGASAAGESPAPKPARKVVQIVCSGDDGLWALDADGSIWTLDMRKDMPWLKLPPLPQPGDER